MCNNEQSSAGQCRHASDEDQGCTEEETQSEEDEAGWRTVLPGQTSFSWDHTRQSISVQTSSYRGSWERVFVEISHRTSHELMGLEIKFGQVQVYAK